MAKILTAEQIEEHRKNLAFIRENAPSDPVDAHLFTTNLQLQEEWLATVDAYNARDKLLKEALANMIQAEFLKQPRKVRLRLANEGVAAIDATPEEAKGRSND